MSTPKQRRWTVTIHIEAEYWHLPHDRSQTKAIPPGTYMCVQEAVKTDAGIQQWLVIAEEGEFKGWGAWLDSLQSKSKPGKKDALRQEVPYFTLEPLDNEKRPAKKKKSKGASGSNGTLPLGESQTKKKNEE